MDSTCTSSEKMRVAPCVVDLSGSSEEEDDDEDVVELKEFPAHLSHRTPRKPRPFGKPVSCLEMLDDVEKTIEFQLRGRLGNDPWTEAITEYPKDLQNGAREVPQKEAREEARKESQKSSQNSIVLPQNEAREEARKGSQKSSQNSVVLDDDDDDCCILSEDPSRVDVVKTSCGGEDDDSDDLVMTGEVGQVACRDFPHPRHLCVRFPFLTTHHEVFCTQCHCYVCDVKAPCSLWGDGLRGGDHCHASDKKDERWKMLRQYNKTHPTGSSDPATVQHLLSPVPRPSSSPPAGNRESTSLLRGLPGCRPGPADHPARIQYPLQISLNRQARDLSNSCPRHHHSQGPVGARSKVVSHGYLSRKEPHYSDIYLSYHADDGDGSFRQRTVRRVRSSKVRHHPHSSSSTTSSMIRRSEAAASAVASRRPRPISTAAGNVQQECLGGGTRIPDRDTGFLTEAFLEDLSAAAQIPLSSSHPGRTTGQEMQHHHSVFPQPPSVAPPLNFESSPVSQGDEIGARDPHPQWNGAGKSGHSFVDGLFAGGGSERLFTGGGGGGGGSERLFTGGGGSESKATEDLYAPPTLLTDYLLQADSFWDEWHPDSFVGI